MFDVVLSSHHYLYVIFIFHMLYTNFRVGVKSTPKLAQGYFGTLAPISAQVFCADSCANRDRRIVRNGHDQTKLVKQQI